jgi:3-deoxy-D-manno-octulosonic-acid transferase
LLRAAYAIAVGAAAGLARYTPPSQQKWLRALRARSGILDRYTKWARTSRDRTRPLLWMHAPSVGEGLQAKPVLELVRSPSLQIAYTFFSPSAESFANTLDMADLVEYLPFDTPAAAETTLDALLPAALVFSKLDVWPVLVRAAAARGVRVGLISATLSEASSRRYGLARALLRDAYATLDAVGAIDADDAQRLVDLGVRPDAITVTGDTRYDQVWAKARGGPTSHPRLTIVAGSTWPSDEAVLLPAWRQGAPKARLIIAPHEPTAQHLAAIERWARGAGVRHARLDHPDAPTADLVLVDRVGVLGDLYATADIAVVGGGFHGAGLHSTLEPAAFGVPVLFGPRHHSSRDASLLIAAGAAHGVTSPRDLAGRFQDWSRDDRARRHAGDAAREVVRQGLGAAQRSATIVGRLLAG